MKEEYKSAILRAMPIILSDLEIDDEFLSYFQPVFFGVGIKEEILVSLIDRSTIDYMKPAGVKVK